jgi:hypothetical protein
MKFRLFLFKKYCDHPKLSFLAFPLIMACLPMDLAYMYAYIEGNFPKRIELMAYLHRNYRRYINSINLAMKISCFMQLGVISLVTVSFPLGWRVFGLISMLSSLALLIFTFNLLHWMKKAREINSFYYNFFYHQKKKEEKKTNPASSESKFQKALRILGVPSSCTDLSAVRQQYKKLMKMYHPDVYRGHDANQKSKEIIEAYQLVEKTLS